MVVSTLVIVEPIEPNVVDVVAIDNFSVVEVVVFRKLVDDVAFSFVLAVDGTVLVCVDPSVVVCELAESVDVGPFEDVIDIAGDDAAVFDVEDADVAGIEVTVGEGFVIARIVVKDVFELVRVVSGENKVV